MPALPTPVVAQAVRALAWAAFRAEVSWPASRRIVAVGLSFPPPPRDVVFTSLTVDGIPCEEVRALGAAIDSASVLLYLHGGGYTVCSPRTHARSRR